MKSRIAQDRYIIECDCGNPENFLVFDVYDEPGYEDIFITIASNWKRPLRARIRQCIRYLFKVDLYMYTDGVCISQKNIEDLEEVIQKIKGQ